MSSEIVPKASYLIVRNGRFYFDMRVPVDVVAAYEAKFKSKNIRVSLRTTDRRKALRLMPNADDRSCRRERCWTRLWRGAFGCPIEFGTPKSDPAGRSQTSAPHEMTDDHLDKYAVSHAKESLRRWSATVRCRFHDALSGESF